MHKLRKRLTLYKETVRHLQPAQLGEALGGASILSCWQPLCAPSAVKSACMTYCPDFTCTREVVEEPVEPK